MQVQRDVAGWRSRDAMASDVGCPSPCCLQLKIKSVNVDISISDDTGVRAARYLQQQVGGEREGGEWGDGHGAEETHHGRSHAGRHSR
jgi:hypothetical protein